MKRAPHAVAPDFASRDFHGNLYRHYRRFRDETPVFRNVDGVVYLSRYADCVELLSGKAFSRVPPTGGCNPFDSSARAPTPLETMVSHWMMFMDPPRHDVVRKAFSGAFTAKAVAQREAFIRAHARRLLDDVFAGLDDDGEVELLHSFAFLLPVVVIMDLLGMPQADAPLFSTWSTQLTAALDTATAASLRAGAGTALELKTYFGDLRRCAPAGLMQALAADPNSPLTPEELVYGFVFLLMSGHETTKNLIANGIQLLAERPRDLAYLRAHPPAIENAVEEMLRFDSPVQKMSRWTHADAVFGEYLVPRGTLVTALLGAANRDGAVFANPDTFDLMRTKNRHIAFGSGIHHCLGALLARLEGRIGFEELIPRLNGLEPLQHQWRSFSSFRSMECLRVKVRLAR